MKDNMNNTKWTVLEGSSKLGYAMVIGELEVGQFVSVVTGLGVMVREATQVIPEYTTVFVK